MRNLSKERFMDFGLQDRVAIVTAAGGQGLY
jgi:hypothetical protein